MTPTMDPRILNPFRDMREEILAGQAAAEITTHAFTPEFTHINRTDHLTHMGQDEARAFAEDIWNRVYLSGLVPPRPLVINFQPGSDFDIGYADVKAIAMAVWFPVPTLDMGQVFMPGIHLSTEGINQAVVLHEIAHLINDQRMIMGHDDGWLNHYCMLLNNVCGRDLAMFFYNLFRMLHSELLKDNPAETFVIPKHRDEV